MTRDKIDELRELQERSEELADEISDEKNQQKQEAEEQLRSHIDYDDLDEDALEEFSERPYVILPKSGDEAWVVVPRFVPFHVGWLERQTESYNIFVVNKYVDWIDELPDDIREQVGIESEYAEAHVHDNVLELADEDERDEAWDDLGGRDGGLNQRVDDDKIQIKRGSEFDVIAELIERGNLPFTPKPVSEEDLRPEPEGVTLRPYQERAWERFRDTGMIGVYWAPGAGKTYLSLYAGERIGGKKLVVVPSTTLKEQWQERIRETCEWTHEWEVQTYQYLTYNDNLQDYQDSNIKLTVFDECHRLPANTFSKLSTIDTDYRIGLSASPYREDGRTEYIFALTGYPVGLKWHELVELGVVSKPEVTVYLYSTQHQKRKDVPRLVNQRTGKILVFCDSIDRGEKLASKLDAPFVYGETRDRMQKFRENRVVVASRVADEGLSLEDLDVVVEHDFHGSSRRQEAQRVGRVMHGDGEGEHLVQMTDDELEKFEERLYALEEQGFEIRFVRRNGT